MRYICIYILAFGISIISFNLFSQNNSEQGNPFITNYSPRDYKGSGQNWAIVQDSRGVMYFGNGDKGIMQFDGENFRFSRIPNNSTVRSLAIDKNDRIYIGGIGEIGYLQSDSSGKLKYISYLDKLDEKDKKFSDVWATFNTSDGTYFYTDNIIFFINDNEVKTWYPKNSSFFLAYMANNELYVHESGYGLMRINPDWELELIPGGGKFEDEKIYSVIKYKSDKILIITRKQGILLSDCNGNYSNFNTEADQFLEENLVYSCIKLPDNRIACGTLLGGLVIIDENGKITDKIDKNAGLIDDVIYYLFYGSQSTLWVALSNGIARIELDFPITIFDEKKGINGSILNVVRQNGILYATSFTGIYFLEDNHFKQFQNYNEQPWKLLKFPVPGKKDKHNLLIGTNNGLFEIKYNKAHQICEYTYCLAMCLSKQYPNRVYLGINNKLGIIEYINNKWEFRSFVKGVNASIRSLIEDKNGTIWVATDIDGIYKVILEDPNDFETAYIQKYKREDGLPLLDGIRLFAFKDDIIFATQVGAYKYNPELNKFYKESIWDELIPGDINSCYLFNEDNDGDIWISDDLNNPQPLGFIRNFDVNPVWYDKPFKRLPEMGTYIIYNDDNNITWIGGTELLFKYDKSKDNYDYTNDYLTLIRKVIINQDSIIYYGDYKNHKAYNTDSIIQYQGVIPTIAHKDNSIIFQFASPEYSDQSKLIYQYRLEGYDNNWSALTKITRKEYTNLPQGEYTFKVRAINTYDQISKDAKYNFIILTPWYQSIIAYIIYLIFFVLLIVILVRLNTKRLKAEKIKLEKIIKKRTHEIRKQKNDIESKNIALEQQKEEILSQNEEINVQKEELEIHRNNLEDLVKKRTRDLEIAKEKAEESDRLKSSFLANMSHEIRTPMNAIIGFSSLISDPELSVGQKDDLSNHITNNCDSLLRLIDDIIDLSKIESKQLDLQKSNCFVSETLHDLIKVFEEKKISINKRHIKLITNIPDEYKNITIHTDCLRLKQVLSNLTDNALKFTDAGSVEFGYLLINSNDNPKLKFYIKDTGIGMSEQQQKEIFTRFSKIESSKKKLYRGAGLGLAISKYLIELLGGEIWVESKKDKGSIFYFTIPFIKLAKYENNKIIQTSMITNKFIWSNKTILIAEDEDSNYRYLEMVLNKTKAKVVWARDGVEAISMCKQHEPDLILMDIKMPNMDGLEATREIKKTYPEIPVIAQTAYAMENDERLSLEAGCNSYLSKPIKANKLLEVLSTFLISE
ncbi:MAG: response regulator [Bacteroidales bacterium]|nr:response regulator [Bacteroidales bacterium]